MPASYGLTWEPKSRRWRKQHDGKRVVVSVRELKRLGYLADDAAETKESSYQAANSWWADQRRQGVGDPRPGLPPYHPHESWIAVAERKQRWAQKHGQAADAEKYAEQARTLRGLDAGADIDSIIGLDDRAAGAASMIESSTGVELPMDVSRVLIDDMVWADRFSREAPAPPGRTIGEWIDKYLDHVHVRQRSKEISPAEYSGARTSLLAFRNWQGSDSNIDELNADCWERWYMHQQSSDKSIPTKKKRMRYAKAFIRWLAIKELIPLSPAVDARIYAIGSQDVAVPMPDEAVIKQTIAEAPGQLRLHLLLMLNCAFTQKDVAELLQSEVDWTNGTVTRKRSKTRKKKNVPTVRYVLWDETFALLKQYRQPSGDPVLLTKSGKPWIRDSIAADGKRRHKTDAVTSNYRHLRKRLKIDMTMSKLRKAGATVLADSERFARFSQRMLGQAPTSVADKHYIGNDAGQGTFDNAVRWIGERFGFSSSRP